MTALRDLARDIFEAGVAAADPAAALRAAFTRKGLPQTPGRMILISLGKAAPAMLAEAMAHVRADVALAVTHHENSAEVPGARVLRAGHPVPDAAGLAAGQEVMRILDDAGPDDTVLALISGGGSALLPTPAPGLTLSDKQAVNTALLGAGLDITAMNLVRQQLSTLKGGGWPERAAPARVFAFILSDVIGDDLRAIASGPTVAPLGDRAQARAICQSSGIWPDLPGPVRAHLSAPTARLSGTPTARNVLIGSNSHSVSAMCDAIPSGWNVVRPQEPLVGDVASAASRMATLAHAAAPGDVILIGGETTVEIVGSGLGGRNQELALRVALDPRMQELAGDWVFLAGGTDGRDGPTEAAGAIVDAGTRSRIIAGGGDPRDLLANNDSNRALDLARDLLVTEATGTNVADLQILLRH